MTDPTSFVRYSDSLESPAADEADVIAGIIETMTKESRQVAERDGETVRASHAKSTGLLKGTLTLYDDLPEPFRQGLLRHPGRHDVLVRFAQGPGEKLSDSVSTHRGMAIKVLGVEGEKLPGHDAATQDFVLATGTVFAQSSAATFLTAIKGIQSGVRLPEAVKGAVSTASRAINAVYHAAGSDSPTFGFFGHTRRSPLSDAYFSQAALRWGDYVAKLGAFPVSPDLVAAIDETIDTSHDPDAFRHAVVAHFQSRPAEFELRVQLCTDLDAMPVEDSATPWPEDASPYVPVGKLTLPAQDAYSPARQAYFDQMLSFAPAHSLAAHRPLGSLMRARLQTYRALSAYRHERNHATVTEPTGVDAVPD